MALLAGLIVLLGGCKADRVKQPIEPFIEVVLEGLTFPASVNFAPDGTLFILERGNMVEREPFPSKLKRVVLETLEVREIGGVPETHLQRAGRETFNGGALGLEIDPDFEDNRTVYICYHRRWWNRRGKQRIENLLSSFVLVDDQLTDKKILIDRAPGNRIHNGCRVVVGPDDKLYLTTGEAGKRRDSGMLESLAGKIVRLNRDGSIPDDNPFPDSPVWSLGHRNAQGLAFHPQSGDLWSTEHGPSTNDELNVIDQGMFYGWPYCRGEAGIGETYISGRAGTRVCEVPEELEEIYRPAVKSFFPSSTVGISDLTFYQGEAFPHWQGNLLLVTLRGGQLFRLTLDGREVVEEEQLITGLEGDFYGRLRDVTVGPDGFIYVVTNRSKVFPEPRTGLLLRIRPRRVSDD